MKTVLAIGLFVFATALVTPAQDSRADSRADSRPEFINEFNELNAAFVEALDAYMAPYEDVTTPEEAKKIKLDPDKNPRKLMHARYVDLGRRARGKSVGGMCLMWRMEGLVDMEVDQAKTESFAILDELATDYLDWERLDELVAIPFHFARSAPADKLAAALSRIEKSAKYPAVRGGVTLLRASHLLDSPNSAKKADGRKLNLQVQKDYADTPAASRAKGMLYEAEHLQLGMTPEDIVAKDETGKEFRLYDYRGRVTVVTFFHLGFGPSRGMVELLKDKPFALVGVGCGPRDERREGSTRYRAVDAETSRSWSALWNVRVWPTNYVLDHKGVIRYHGLGEELREIVLELVKEAEADARGPR